MLFRSSYTSTRYNENDFRVKILTEYIKHITHFSVNRVPDSYLKYIHFLSKKLLKIM